MKVKFWGVRGSIPCPGPKTARYGGNTSCIQLLGGTDVIILDGGTGIRELGLSLTASRPPLRIHLLLTHTHWDHIQGFPFFTPIYDPGVEVTVYGPRALDRSLEEALMFQMQYAFFPVRGVELAARMKFVELNEQSFEIGPVEFRTKFMNHPIRVLAYKFRLGDRSGAYTGDNEPYYDVLVERSGPSDRDASQRADFIRECNASVVEFFRGSRLLIADAQYTDEEYVHKRGWGHSSVSHVIDLAAAAGVRRVALFHHEPTHPDNVLDRMARDVRRMARSKSRTLKPFMAREGMVVDV
ncbi:MAG: MBL fold metallo-hydrolase [Planctomycetes bacterium]|nr:MBL fold metallo-hydrolase [Planctomycetota bacterium]